MSGDPRRSVSRAQWLRRLASRRKDRTAFVLSGGGPYGALQVGGLRALYERGVVPDLIVGTSAGSLNAAFLAFDPTDHGVARLESIWRSLEDEDLFPGVRFKTSWARMLMRGNRVFENLGLRRLVETRLGAARFEDAKVPFAVVATDLETGGETTFSSGDVIDPLLASCAMPSIYPPVTIGGRDYIDGGVANAVPVMPAVAMGANRVIVLNCSPSQQKPRPLLRPIDHLLHGFQLARGRRWELERDQVAARVELVDIPVPKLDFSITFTSLAHTEELIAGGYATAAAYLDGRLTPDTVVAQQ